MSTHLLTSSAEDTEPDKTKTNDTLYSVRVPTPSDRHEDFAEYGGSDAKIEDGFNFSLDFFTALPSNLDNYTKAETAGVVQGRCWVTAASGPTLLFPPPSLECIQTFYFIISSDGTYQDSMGTRSLFLTNSAGNTPLMITGGTGKYKYVQGEAQNIVEAATSPSGNNVYDGYSFTLKNL
ncbi:hypothetical protein KFL_000200120 [Klebsormidium nitens]|uniref:Dirigent protein n=1 Tax=Klebsormidium nitens TaxID=105231 RepID=A0A1Y1HJX6_KLENI|nr:hypothetical protein KFL_000200120 [Klebsormidium nitens]|eukprot:GAQ78860.1 hypothetical protein KFL_000200120 [Klebsormidium nitens]